MCYLLYFHKVSKLYAYWGTIRIMDVQLDRTRDAPIRFVFTTLAESNRFSVPHKASSASCFCGLSSVSKRLY